MDPAYQRLLDELNGVSISETDLRDQVRKAIVFAERDPMGALVRSRKALEWMVRRVCEVKLRRVAGTQSLKSLLELIIKEGHLPIRPATHANTVREFGNYGAHVLSEEPTRLEAVQCVESLLVVIAWYAEQNLPDVPERQSSGADRADAGARRPRRGISALIHYHCDRSEQVKQVEKALKRSRPSGPFVFIVHGDENQCHDKFLDRLKEDSLPGFLRLDPARCGVKTHVIINYPTERSDPRKFRERLLEDLGIEFCKSSTAEAEEIARAFAELEQPLMIQAFLPSDEWIPGASATIAWFLEFWNEWPVAGARYVPLIFLIVTYQVGSRGRLFGWYRRFRHGRANARLRLALAELARSDGSVVVLDELRGVTEEDLKGWARKMYAEKYCGELDVRPEVVDLCQRLGLGDSERRAAMEVVAVELKRLLAQSRAS